MSTIKLREVNAIGATPKEFEVEGETGGSSAPRFNDVFLVRGSDEPKEGYITTIIRSSVKYFNIEDMKQLVSKNPYLFVRFEKYQKELVFNLRWFDPTSEDNLCPEYINMYVYNDSDEGPDVSGSESFAIMHRDAGVSTDHPEEHYELSFNE